MKGERKMGSNMEKVETHRRMTLSLTRKKIVKHRDNFFRLSPAPQKVSILPHQSYCRALQSKPMFGVRGCSTHLMPVDAGCDSAEFCA